MLIRPATCAEDVQGIHAIEVACFSCPWHAVDIAIFLTSPDCVMLVAEEDGQILGYAGMRMVLDEGQIQNVATAPDARRRGVADALLSELFVLGKANALAMYTLEVRASNAAAQALYAKHGFAMVGRRRGYYTAPSEDAVLMTKTIEEQA